jgi:hypothetical protein
LLTQPFLLLSALLASPSFAAGAPVETPKPYDFSVSRNEKGLVTVDLKKFNEELAAGMKTKKDLPPVAKLRIFIDNVSSKNVPAGTNVIQISLAPKEQFSVRVEALSAENKVIERTHHRILEKTAIRIVNPSSYEGEPVLKAETPIDEELKIDSEMPGVVQRIGRRKIVYVWKHPESKLVKSLPDSVDFRVQRNAKGRFTAFLANGKKVPVSAAFVKVDAAFNENAFLWDDMFTCLHALNFDPELCRSTLSFWLNVQKNQGQGAGDIPREVLKSNGSSYNLYEIVHLGETVPNGNYANPNFMGDVAEQLVDQTGVSKENKKLMRDMIASLEAYALWMDTYRAVKENGVTIGYWISDLGSGMDNIGRAPNDNFRATGYVDELARRAELEKSAARLAARLGDFSQAKRHEERATEFDSLLNSRYWSPEKNFYFDLIPGEGEKFVRQEDMPTVAGFWPLFSRSASPEQMMKIEAHWYSPETFGGTFPVRSLPPIINKFRPGSYHAEGGYWRGGNWPPTDIIKALGEERSGRPDLAASSIAKKLAVDTIISNDEVKKGGHKTVYETLGTNEAGHPQPGVQVEPDGRVHETRKDFVGWGGTPHTFGKIRHLLGVRPVGAFSGPHAKTKEWRAFVENSEVFKNYSHFAQNPSRGLKGQSKLFSEGYLEINPPFDLSKGPLRLENFQYGGQFVNLTAEKAGENSVKVTVASKSAMALNLAFNKLVGAKLEAASPLKKVKLAHGGSTLVVLPLIQVKD